MKCSPRPPTLVMRDARAIAQALADNRRGYTPEWTAGPGRLDAGSAINAILARYVEIQNEGVNAMPQRLQLEFLDALGASVLAPQPARAPLVFKLLDTASGDATVPQGTRVAAVLPPPAPSLASDAPPARAIAPEFYTEQEITAMRGKLAALYSIDPQADLYVDHGAAATSGFGVFDAMAPVPHRLYLAHASLFNFTGSAEIVLSFDFASARGGAAGTQRPLLIDWEYLSADGWQPLILVDDGTARFTRDGKVTLAKSFGPDSQEGIVGGHSSQWIRGTVSSRTPHARLGVEPAGYVVRYTEPLPAARDSTAPVGHWIHYAPFAGVPQPVVGDVVFVGALGALLLAIDRDRLVVDVPIMKSIPGAVLLTSSSTPFGTVLAGLPQGGQLFADTLPPNPSGVDILSDRDGVLIVSGPLRGAVAGTPLHTALGDTAGVVVSSSPNFRLGVESAHELLPRDVVTLDGTARATVVQTDDTALFLGEPLDGVQPGLTVELADALPPLRPDGADAAGALPQVDLIRVRVGFGKNGLPLDSAYVDSASIDISKDFFPFGEQPARFATFYAACKDAFTRERARIDLVFTFNDVGPLGTGVKVQAEYFDGARWQALGAGEDYVDGSASFTRPQPADAGFPNAKLSFTVPAGWADNEVNGEKQRWLRLRIVAGDFGKPLSVDVVPDPSDATKFSVTSVPSTLRPPIITHLGVNYYVFTNPQAADYCVTENDFAFTEHSDDARWPRSGFAPFAPVSDRTPALHFGFSNAPPTALVSLLAEVVEPPPDGDPQPYAWDYWGPRGWTELSVRDTTLGLRRTGLMQFVGAPDALPREGLGGALYRIRARLKSGLQSQDQIVQLGGVWLNAAWARQGQRIDRDGLGTSNGNPGQSIALPIVRALKAAPSGAAGNDGSNTAALDAAQFERALDTPLAGVPILGDEVLEVREWAGRGDDWQTTLAGVDPDDLRFEVDPQEPTVMTAAWVRWHAQPHFYRSGPDDRHYRVERARGVFEFPGADGFIPPAGAPIVVSYVTGGGFDGNVPVGAVCELRSGVGFVQSVTNPVAAAGGAIAESLRAARDRSAQQVRHRDRAVSVEDYEWLALGASSEVARVRALPLEGAAGTGARGNVGIVIVPHSQQAQPFASAELERTVVDALAQRAPAGVAGGIRIVAPSYVPVGVRAEILPLRAEDAGRVEALVRMRMRNFLHPLVGGREGHGWDFGQSVFLSDLAALIEDTPGVDAVRFLQLMVGATVCGDRVPVAPQQLIAAGNSQLMLIVPSVPYALA